MSEVQQRGDVPAGASERHAGGGVGNLPTKRRAKPAWRHNSSLPARSVDCLWPWTKHTYPGLYLGMTETLGIEVTAPTIYYWATEKNRLPVWAAERFRDTLRSRARREEALADELDAYIASRASELRHQKGLRRRVDE